MHYDRRLKRLAVLPLNDPAGASAVIVASEQEEQTNMAAMSDGETKGDKGEIMYLYIYFDNVTF